MSIVIIATMNINTITPNFLLNQPNTFSKKVISTPSFNGNGIQRLTHMNIGMMPKGYIGDVILFNKKLNKDVFINVFKDFDCGDEKYLLKDDNSQILGEIGLRIKKFFNYDSFMYKEDPSHVFVSDLYNYSRQDTPFANKRVDEYSQIGVRLLQIAQRRSDEAQCVGNIKLISMPEAEFFYRNKIGMLSDPNAFNKNALYLPPDKKEPLSKMYGGL